MTTMTAESVADLFEQAITLSRDGDKASPRGLPTREALGVTLRLTRPRARLLLPAAAGGRVLNTAFAAAECVWILSGSNDPWIYDYNSRLRQYADEGVLRGAYGPRLRSWRGEVDQLEHVVELLRRDPDSRQAVIQLYDPQADAPGHKDIPCTLGWRFQLRQGRLHMATTMRSQDVWTGLPYDLFTFTVLHELVAGWLGVELGEYRHHVDSLHLYETDLDLADAALGKVASPEMDSLATPWSGFDAMLDRVRGFEPTVHPAWDSFTAVMAGYRCWKEGRYDKARTFAALATGPMRQGLEAWFEELEHRRHRGTQSATAGAVTR